MKKYDILKGYDFYTLHFISDVNPYYSQIIRRALHHKEGNEFSVVINLSLSIALSNSDWLTLFWPANNVKACAFNSSCHKKCYWSDFDVAVGSQAFTFSAALLLMTYVRSTAIARKLTSRRCCIKYKANTNKLADTVYILLLITQ